jgi:hypothetical protein
MDQQQTITLLDSVFLSIKRSRQPEDSLDLLNGLISLSTASKALKNLLREEIIIHICYKYLRGTIANYLKIIATINLESRTNSLCCQQNEIFYTK